MQKRLRAASVRGSRLVDYMNHIAGFPVYENSAAKFFPLGEDMFEQLMEELKAAKHFIFMEYFIIDRGYMWDSILEVLRKKAAEGVEVRVMYDGMCCLMLLPYHYPQKLEKNGHPVPDVFTDQTGAFYPSELQGSQKGYSDRWTYSLYRRREPGR